MSVQQRMVGLAAKIGPKEMAAAGGLLAAITLYCAGTPIQKVEALEAKPYKYPEHMRKAKLQRRPSHGRKSSKAPKGKVGHLRLQAQCSTRQPRRDCTAGPHGRESSSATPRLCKHTIRTSIMGNAHIRKPTTLSSHPLHHSGVGKAARPVHQQHRHPTERSGDPVRERPKNKGEERDNHRETGDMVLTCGHMTHLNMNACAHSSRYRHGTVRSKMACYF